MSIALRGGEGLVSHEFLDGIGIHPLLGKAGGKDMAKVVKPEAFDLGVLKSFLKGPPQSMEVYFLPARVREDKILPLDQPFLCPRPFL